MDHSDADDEEGPDDLEDIPCLALDIEITPVYKPRPVRQRAHLVAGPVATIARPQRRAHKMKDKKQQQPWHSTSPPIAADGVVTGQPLATAVSPQDRALQKRMARDKRREEKRKAMRALAETAVADLVAAPLPRTEAPVATSMDDDPVSSVVDELRALHVEVQSADAVVVDAHAPSTKDTETLTPHAAACDLQAPSPPAAHAKLVANAKVPRLIVEALVVRKLSLEEGFLDLASFE